MTFVKTYARYIIDWSGDWATPRGQIIPASEGTLDTPGSFALRVSGVSATNCPVGTEINHTLW